MAFGPVPRSYEHSLPKKVRRAALRGALSQRFAEGAIIVVDDLAVDGYATKRVAAILAELGLSGESVLIVIDEANEFVERSARNLRRVGLLRAAGLNVYDVLRHPKLLVTKAAVAAIDERLSDGPRRTPEAAE